MEDYTESPVKRDLMVSLTIEETLLGFKEQYLPKRMTPDILEELFPYVQKVINEEHTAV